jgi:L-serine dehydratase
MSLSLFDIVGPVMVGPSSSHTAGAARIGFLAGKIAGIAAEQVTLYFHPVLMQTYAGHRTHAALIGGLLGYREDDLRLKAALEDAAQRGLTFDVKPIERSRLKSPAEATSSSGGGPDVHPNTMRLKIVTKEGTTIVSGISVGGGCIEITEIDGLAVQLDGNYPFLLVRSAVPIERHVTRLLGDGQIVATYAGATAQGFLACLVLRELAPQALLDAIASQPYVTAVRAVPALSNLQQLQVPPTFSNFSEFLALASDKGLAAAAAEYETKRTGRSAADIREIFRDILRVMRESVATGLENKFELLGGFCAGDDGAKMMTAYREGRTISGGILPLAIARALSVMEVNGSMGRVVAAPTAGSAGVLPAIIFCLAESLKKTDDDLCDALLVAAAVGVCIANKASLSGAVGGCQGEIGVAAAIAASAAAFLGGGDPEQCIQAAALTLKNLLGLICDPPAGPVEVPCIKRNAIGVAAALMAADMALAGIKSYIPPDEVVDALVNVQKLLPQQLKGSTIGGLGCTATGEKMRLEWQLKLKQMN